MIDGSYIAEILGRFEGKAVTKGYVPQDRDGNVLGVPGITVGTGFDLGQQDDLKLDALKLPEALTEKLRPYLGMKRGDAVKYLASRPLLLTAEEVTALDGAVRERYVNETAAMFGPCFDGIPKQARAVAVSLHYQFGTPRRQASPALAGAWEALKEGRWREAAGLLAAPEGWGAEHRKYLPRRREEAALLREIPVTDRRE